MTGLFSHANFYYYLEVINCGKRANDTKVIRYQSDPFCEQRRQWICENNGQDVCGPDTIVHQQNCWSF